MAGMNTLRHTLKAHRGFLLFLLGLALFRTAVADWNPIPSASMRPTLLEGDVVLVNRLAYDLKLPLTDIVLLRLSEPQRGDVVTFSSPAGGTRLIKRIVGLPGDLVEWRNQRLFLNGQEVPTEAKGPFYDADSMVERPLYTEKLGDIEHRMLVDRERSAYFAGSPQFPFSENCQYSVEAIRCTVPAGHYYALGDNRDNSGDSRVWGFVPDQNLVGKAVFIWMNFSDLGRVGGFR